MITDNRFGRLEEVFLLDKDTEKAVAICEALNKIAFDKIGETGLVSFSGTGDALTLDLEGEQLYWSECPEELDLTPTGCRKRIVAYAEKLLHAFKD